MSAGGKRKGSGRKPGDPQLKKVPVGIRLPRWMLEWMREQDKPQAELIEDAMVKHHKLKSPR